MKIGRWLASLTTATTFLLGGAVPASAAPAGPPARPPAGPPPDTTLTMASEVIHSVVTGTSREVYLTVPDTGLIDNLPAEACVEVPAVVGGSGVHPSPIGPLPVQLAALNRTFLNVVELTVTAALQEQRSAVYQAAMLDPNTSATLPVPAIEALCDELIDAHRALLPAGITRGRRAMSGRAS
ncbi:hypothetical protein [Nonomuraea sp. NPDC049709]|uniref:family 4 glycosyl hydrolase n=1 Tax=Nonomuraea sp. NPDC049709 TaxID=3154736 RepID=UPI00342C0881